MRILLKATAGALAFAALIVASTLPPSAAQADQPAGITRTDLQRHDLSVAGHEAVQVRVDLAPGVAFPKHTHPGEEIIYVLAGGKYRNYASDGKVTEGTLQAGDVLYRDPLTHAAENIGDTPLHMILVEL